MTEETPEQVAERLIPKLGYQPYEDLKREQIAAEIRRERARAVQLLMPFAERYAEAIRGYSPYLDQPFEGSSTLKVYLYDCRAAKAFVEEISPVQGAEPLTTKAEGQGQVEGRTASANLATGINYESKQVPYDQFVREQKKIAEELQKLSQPSESVLEDIRSGYVNEEG